MSHHQEAKQRSTVVPFLLGGMVGVAIGLLLAPKSGNQMRQQIKDLAADTRDRLSSTINKGMDIYDDAKVALDSAVAAGKQAFIQEREKFETAMH